MIINLRPMFFLTMSWNTTCGWQLGFTQYVSCAIVYANDHKSETHVLSDYVLKYNLRMVTRIHSECKLCYCVYTNDRNLRPMFFLLDYALKHNLWMVTWIRSACKLCYCVHTHVLSNYILKHNLWMVTRIHSGGKLCYCVCVNDKKSGTHVLSDYVLDGDLDSLRR